MFCFGKRRKALIRAVMAQALTLARIEETQSFIIKQLKKMATEVDNLAAAVAENTQVDQSAILLLQQLSILIKNAANSGDLAKVQELADNIHASSQALAAAITANTPVTAPPVTTDKTYTATTGETIVVSQTNTAGPSVGDAVTVNGVAPTDEVTYTLSDGATISVAAGKVSAFAAVATGGGQ